jgi:hypothetical protein
MTEHAILGLMVLIQTGLLVAGLRMLQLVVREVGDNSALTKATLDVASNTKSFQIVAISNPATSDSK